MKALGFKQDVYLTGSPSITFWKVVYRRHTQFALEAISQTFNGQVDFGKKVSCTLSRNGDLISTMWLEIELTKKTGVATYFPAENFVRQIDLSIGGQVIDKVYSDWYRIYDELTRNSDEKAAYKRLADFDQGDNLATSAAAGRKKKMYLPVSFFFSRTPGLALPLIALQYHEVKLDIQFAPAAEMLLAGVDTAVAPTATLWGTYVFLDVEERRRYAQSSHEFLITQLQFTGSETITPASTTRTTNVRLNYNHPVKFLTWVVKSADPAKDNHGAFTVAASVAGTGQGESNEKYAVIASAKLQLNGSDRFAERRGSYFSQCQTFEHFQSLPKAGVYLYSFALKPEEHQPSGTCNFSRIDNATLVLTTKACTATTSDLILDDTVCAANAIGNLTNLLVFAENYNVLRIASGIERNFLCRTASCRDGSENLHRGQTVKDLGFVYNSLVGLSEESCNTLDCGDALRAKSTPPLGKPGVSKQGNDLADRNNDLDWVIRRHSPKPVIARVRRRLRDYQGVGSRKLATSYESLRYSPPPCESTGMPWGGLHFSC